MTDPTLTEIDAERTYVEWFHRWWARGNAHESRPFDRKEECQNDAIRTARRVRCRVTVIRRTRFDDGGWIDSPQGWY